MTMVMRKRTMTGKMRWMIDEYSDCPNETGGKEQLWDGLGIKMLLHMVL